MVRPVVIVKQGWLRGVEMDSDIGGTFLAFKGIPYAEPPTGELRFKDPQPPKSWTGVKNAGEEGPPCIQWDDFATKIEGEEDCLYLTVNTMSLMGSRPVMVWIHGGGFMWGHGGDSLYGPDYLMKNGVVFVSFNYRLGVFGFLSLDHEAAPGNMGLKDQVAALRWVKENIGQFGGDSNNITIFGESAGGASVHYLMMSPLTTGLFHKAIIQSGLASSPWARAFKTSEIAQRIVTHLGKDTTDPNEIITFLRSVAAGDLCKIQHQILTPKEFLLFGYPFAPSVDSCSPEPFLPQPVSELLKQAQDVPLLIGYNSHEGSITLRGFNEETYFAFNESLEDLIRHGLVNLSSSELADAVNEIRLLYFNDGEVGMDLYNEYIRFMGDYNFLAGIHEVVELRTKAKSQTYLYRFHYEGAKKMSTLLWSTEFEGCGHFDDIAYLFYPTAYPDLYFIEEGTIEKKISDRFLKMWTSFAKTGNPTPRIDNLITTKWEPVTSTTKNYLAIGSDLSAGVNPDEEMWQFWRRFLITTNNQ